ncbi:hypothetical protein LSH36_1691g00015 [Paralvinella palmiformis]|uniref:Uncharacterized protein n=1 Tax=Paralvinella palmiformis TaxID=53620 RepID=A0AAD9IRN8_9ANNE|nr:hypothetical protein LSH36_1691g00015 [Paralvinella palmiformis]
MEYSPGEYFIQKSPLLVAVRQGVRSIFHDPTLRVEGRKGHLVEELPENIVVLGTQGIYAVVDGLLREKRLLVLLVVYFLLDNRLLHTFCVFFLNIPRI